MTAHLRRILVHRSNETRASLLNALERTNWKISGKGGAAELLGIKPSTLESRMKSFAIAKPM
jgi:transcriptional regulator of acetoin/glycerol metabolism